MDTPIPQPAVQPAMPDGVAAIEALHNRTVDVLAGYAKMVETAEPSFQTIAEEFRSLHARHADHLARMIADLGYTPDPDGTVMGTINRAVVSVRAMFDKIDEDVMDNVRTGEQHVLDAFDEALAANLGTPASPDLGDMREEVVALLARTAHLD